MITKFKNIAKERHLSLKYENMESLVQRRGSYRSAFTIFSDKVEEFLKHDDCDFHSCASFLVQLRKKYRKVKCLDEEILAMLQESETCSHKILDMERKSANTYKDIFVDLKIKLVRRLQSPDKLKEMNQKISASKSSFGLPKIQLQKSDD